MLYPRGMPRPPATPDHPIAVLTGDIVGSRKLGGDVLERVLSTLAERADDCGEAFSQKHFSLGGLDVVRGDGWQWAVREPRLAVRAALRLRAAVLALSPNAANRYDTRIGLGFGLAERVKPKNLSASVGEAFERSGAALDRLASRRRLAVEPSGSVCDVAGPLLEAALSHTTARQASALCVMLDVPTPQHETAAERLQPPVDRSTLTHLLSSGHTSEILEALEHFEAMWPDTATFENVVELDHEP